MRKSSWFGDAQIGQRLNLHNVFCSRFQVFFWVNWRNVCRITTDWPSCLSSMWVLLFSSCVCVCVTSPDCVVVYFRRDGYTCMSSTVRINLALSSSWPSTMRSLRWVRSQDWSVLWGDGEELRSEMLLMFLSGDTAGDQLQTVHQWLPDQTHPENHQISASAQGTHLTYTKILELVMKKQRLLHCLKHLFFRVFHTIIVLKI